MTSIGNSRIKFKTNNNNKKRKKTLQKLPFYLKKKKKRRKSKGKTRWNQWREKRIQNVTSASSLSPLTCLLSCTGVQHRSILLNSTYPLSSCRRTNNSTSSSSSSSTSSSRFTRKLLCLCLGWCCYVLIFFLCVCVFFVCFFFTFKLKSRQWFRFIEWKNYGTNQYETEANNTWNTKTTILWNNSPSFSFSFPVYFCFHFVRQGVCACFTGNLINYCLWNTEKLNGFWKIYFEKKKFIFFLFFFGFK